MITSRWYQSEAEDKGIFDYFEHKQGNPVIAMPTASGKSIVIGKSIKRILTSWPNQRIICATHVKELIDQNYKKLIGDPSEGKEGIWPEAPAGIFSAGLKRKEVMPITFGGIKSMVKNPALFGHVDLLKIDECHLVGHKESSEYLTFIKALKSVNPHLKVIGYSATPWRMGRGLISDGPIFTDISYDLTDFKSFERLIKEGFLCTLIPKRTKTELNVSDVKITAGEYNLKDLAEAVDKDPITYAACKETIEMGGDRLSWLCFASSVKHAENIAAMLQSMGVDARAVHSDMGSEQRDEIIKDFKDLKLKCCVNYGILTTGFDHPALDFIIVLRPTASSALWVQILGRGMRPCPETNKENCLVADFAGNTKRLGPINDPVIPRKKGEKPGVAPVRICNNCGCYNHARASMCIACGAVFDNSPKLTITADTQELIRQTAEPIAEVHDVQRVNYIRHFKAGIPPSIKVQYWCGLKMFTQYVCLEHGGFAAKQARDWWKRHFPQFSKFDPPQTTDQALMYISQAKVPRQIMVHVNRRYPEVTATIF